MTAKPVYLVARAAGLMSSTAGIYEPWRDFFLLTEQTSTTLRRV